MGCSPTKNHSLVIVPTIKKCQPISIYTNGSHHHQETRRIENCILIYLTKQSSTGVQKTVIEQLRRIVSTLQSFTDTGECVTFIQDIREEKVFLIISSEMGTFADRFQHLPEVEKVYVIDETKLANLCEQLGQDIKNCELDLLGITAVTTEGSISSKQTALFLYAQLAKEIAVRLKFENEHKSDFLEFCRAHYADHHEQLQAIADFERHYRPQKALSWLTKSCFVSRILDRVQRTLEIDLIYKLGFFIKHLHMQLSALHEKLPSQREHLFIAYRGKSMHSDEFDTLVRNNCGGLLSFTNFITASTDKKVTVEFIRQRLATHPELMSVLFEIHIDPTIPNTTYPFGLLDSPTDNEICFTWCTVFRIESVDQVIDNSLIIQTVKLTLVDDNDQQLHRLLTPLRSSDVHANPLSSLGKRLIDMGEYNRAEQFYLKMQVDPAVLSQPRRLVRVLNGLAAIFSLKGEHSKALEQYQKVLEVSLSYLQPDHPDLASIYTAIGDCYLNISDHRQALQNYERAVQLAKQTTQTSDKEFIDNLHNRIIHMRQLIEHNE